MLNRMNHGRNVGDVATLIRDALKPLTPVELQKSFMPRGVEVTIDNMGPNWTLPKIMLIGEIPL